MHKIELMHGTLSTKKFKPHFHETYTVIFVNDGQADYLNGSADSFLSEGQILILNPYDVHTGRSIDDCPWGFMTMYVPVDFMLSVLGLERGDKIPVFEEKLIRDRDLYEKGIRTCLMMIANQYDPYLINSFFRKMITGYATKKSESIALFGHADIGMVRNHIHDYYQSDVSLEQLCDIARVSNYNLVKQFKKKYQLPPHQYLLNLRIERAKALITDSQLSLTEVGYKVGFFDQSHFIRHFKKITGITPRQFALAKA